MAVSNKTITNPVTGQSILFIRTSKDTSGQVLEMESVYQPHSIQPSEHYHPKQKEDFKVLEGEITVKLNGRTRVLREGDILHIPANMKHAMWNTGATPARVNWQVRPAMETEFLLENTFGLAADGQVNRKGTPFITQAAPILLKYDNVFRLAKPPYIIQQIVFGMIGLFSALGGKKGSYRKYID